MNLLTDRRSLVKTLAAGSVGLVLNRGVSRAAQANPVKITDLESLDKEFSTKEFKFADASCLLVRLPKPTNTKSRRIFRVKRKDKDGKTQIIYLTAYTRICTHLGCTPALPDEAHQSTCPCHGSVYAFDGSVVQGPAERALQAIKLESKGGAVIATALFEDK
jgi:cytochrome b6-f complex iron-sulfur subunit